MSNRRDIQIPWTCSRSGSCCEAVGEVVMTHAERAKVESAASTPAALLWLAHPDRRFIRLKAHPCPLLAREADGTAVCTVHDVRPFTCRTFMCGRVDVTTEPYESEPVNFALGITGCGNLTARLQESERFRQHYATNARQHFRAWGQQMGWTR